jgi:hypothetical protein
VSVTEEVLQKLDVVALLKDLSTHGLVADLHGEQGGVERASALRRHSESERARCVRSLTVPPQAVPTTPMALVQAAVKRGGNEPCWCGSGPQIQALPPRPRPRPPKLTIASALSAAATCMTWVVPAVDRTGPYGWLRDHRCCHTPHGREMQERVLEAAFRRVTWTP